MQGRVKRTHIVLEAIIILLSGMVFFPLSKNTEHFDQNCLLNSNIHITRHDNNSVSLDLTTTVFGDVDDCHYTTFFSVVVSLHGIVWIWFFFHLDDLASKEGSSVNLLLSALFTHFVLFVCAIASSVMIGDGFTTWCDSIEGNNNNQLYSLSCKDYQSLYWTVDRSNFYTYNQMALVCSWLAVACLLVSMVVTCIHLYWDFLETTYKEPFAKGPLETSGFVDNGVGILNKMALTLNNSTDGFYTDSLEGDNSYNVNRTAGDGAAVTGSGSGGGRGAYNVSNNNNNNNDDNDDDDGDRRSSPSSDEIVVNATVHTPEDFPGSGGRGVLDIEDGLRSRSNVSGKL